MAIDIQILQIFTIYLMPGTSNNGGEHSSWGIVSCKASFAHSRAIVNNQGCNFIFHFSEQMERVTVLKVQLCAHSLSKALCCAGDWTLDVAVAQFPVTNRTKETKAVLSGSGHGWPYKAKVRAAQAPR